MIITANLKPECKCLIKLVLDNGEYKCPNCPKRFTYNKGKWRQIQSK